MKKLLLALSAAAICAPAFATVDPATYAAAPNGLTCTSVWIKSRTHNLEELQTTTGNFLLNNNKIRSTAVLNDMLIMGYSKPEVIDEKTYEHTYILIYDLMTGKFLKEVQVTVDGAPINGTLCINQVGVDDFGHLWFTGANFDVNTKPVPVYYIADPNTGVATKAFEYMLPSDEASAAARRVDYFDVVGDVTLQQSSASILFAVANDDGCTVIGGTINQDKTWSNVMNDGDYAVGLIEETYPAGQTTWNGAPMVRIVRSEDHTPELFYVDAFVTPPTLYNTSGSMLDSFENCGDALADLAPKNNANGCVEFTLGGETYFVYALSDYDQGGSRVNVAKMGEGDAFEGMQLLWTLPEKGLGEISDTGSRMFGMNPVLKKDKSGKEAIYLPITKCNNGFGLYRIAQPGFNASDVESSGVESVEMDDPNAPVEIFNLNGVRVSEDNMAPGLYIKRQGTKATKMVVK
ncbi:MAG: hypothetical protein UHP27_06655 [Muribaculaceae bacterium]|nr:hypothetical protein [Muribaculaceae bacterium]